MTDVQCPAVILFITPDTIGAPELRSRRLAGVFIAQSIPEHSPAFSAAQQLAAANSCKAERFSDEASLKPQVNQLADLYRGEIIAVLAPSDEVRAAIHRAAPPAEPITVAIDDDGWNVLAAGSRVT